MARQKGFWRLFTEALEQYASVWVWKALIALGVCLAGLSATGRIEAAYRPYVSWGFMAIGAVGAVMLVVGLFVKPPPK